MGNPEVRMQAGHCLLRKPGHLLIRENHRGLPSVLSPRSPPEPRLGPEDLLSDHAHSCHLTLAQLGTCGEALTLPHLRRPVVLNQEQFCPQRTRGDV